MRRWFIAAAVASAAGLGFVTGVAAGDAGWLGAARSHRSIERFEMSVGVTAGQHPRRPTRFEEVRQVLHVPSHYGTLLTIIGDAHDAVLWYRTEGGVLRNVVVQETGARLYRVEQEATSRLEVDEREE